MYAKVDNDPKPADQDRPAMDHKMSVLSCPQGALVAQRRNNGNRKFAIFAIQLLTKIKTVADTFLLKPGISSIPLTGQENFIMKTSQQRMVGAFDAERQRSASPSK